MRPRGDPPGPRYRRGSAFLLLLLVAASARLYGALLVLYPKAFRRRYSAEMRRDFCELLREGLEEGSVTELVRVWAQGISDLVLTALKERNTVLAARNAQMYADPRMTPGPIEKAMVVVTVATITTNGLLIVTVSTITTNGLLTLVIGLMLCAGTALALPRVASSLTGRLGGRAVRQGIGEAGTPTVPPADPSEAEGIKEKELLLALGRCGKLTALGAALESSLSVEEAERILQALAARGHLEVTVEHGRLLYSLWESDAPL